MKKIVIICSLLVFIPKFAFAQWTIKQSELPGSKLEQIHNAQPYAVHVVPDEEWNNSNFATDKEPEWFKNAKFGMFIHFGLSTFKNKELSWGVAQRVMPDIKSNDMYPREVWTSWADSLRLENFNQKELVDIIKKSGIKYVVVVAKHHDGFHLWDTKYSNFKSTNSPYGKDFIKEVVNACNTAGVKVGIYYSQRDWYHPDYEPVDENTADVIGSAPYFKAKEGMKVKAGKNHQKYIDYQFDVVKELCTNYGKIDIFWFDAVYWNGMFTPDMWDAERLTRMIRQLQPGILINNRTSIPGDFDTPEQRIGFFQNNRPWESCMTLCEGWSYSPSKVKTPLEVFQQLQSTAIGDGNLLLSWGMMWDGNWDETQKQSFIGAGSYLKKYGEAVYNTHGGPWLPENWGGTTFKGNKVYVHIIHKPENNIIVLPDLGKGFDIVKDKILSGQPISIEKQGKDCIIDLKQIKEIDSPIIIELTTSRNLTIADTQQQRSSGLFSDKKIYGDILLSKKTQSEKNIVLDFNDLKKVKGVEIINENEAKELTVTISLSKDGKSWQTYKTVKLDSKTSQIPVSRSQAGTLIEGIDAKQIKLDFSHPSGHSVTCSIYGE